MPLEIPWWPAKAASYDIPAYSPRGDSDERPNVRDARYTATVNDAPAEIPLSSTRALYAIVALVVLALLGTIAGAVFASPSEAPSREPAATGAGPR